MQFSGLISFFFLGGGDMGLTSMQGIQSEYYKFCRQDACGKEVEKIHTNLIYVKNMIYV